jgi:hypothetical protein
MAASCFNYPSTNPLIVGCCVNVKLNLAAAPTLASGGAAAMGYPAPIPSRISVAACNLKDQAERDYGLCPR